MDAQRIGELMEGLGRAAVEAAARLAVAPSAQKNAALVAAAAAVRARGAAILAANERDLAAARAATWLPVRIQRHRSCSLSLSRKPARTEPRPPRLENRLGRSLALAKSKTGSDGALPSRTA